MYIHWVVIVILENDWKTQHSYSRKKFSLIFKHVSQPFSGEFIQGGPFLLEQEAWLHAPMHMSHMPHRRTGNSQRRERDKILQWSLECLTKIHQCNNRCWKCCLICQMYSVYLWNSAVNSPKFFSRNFWNVVADVVSQLFQSVGIRFIQFVLQSKNYTCLINLQFLTILWPFVQTFSKHVSWASRLKDFLGGISSLTQI